ASVTVTSSPGPPPTPCNIVVTAPPDVIAYTGPGATTCSTVVSDATLGTASVTADCQLAGGIFRFGVPEGNVFPVGVSIVTYSATDGGENEGLANQTVTVIDNTLPTVTCPPSVTVEFVDGSGAPVSYAAPVSNDNCEVASETSIPAS